MVGARIVDLLKRLGYSWPPQRPVGGKEIQTLIVISLGRAKLHDSGYPYIQVYGADIGGVLYDLGRHDHIWLRPRWANMDSLGANVFRIWFDRPMRVGTTHFVSTLEVYDDYTVG